VIQEQDHTRILSSLSDIEAAYGVRILYACESGSRVWGFESPNSDYDVRFIYVRPLREYLKIHDGRDVIATNVHDIDLAGWDLKKSLGLMLAGNPHLMEYLTSPTVYISSRESDELKSMMEPFVSHRAMCYHYYGMARRNYMAYLKPEKETVSIKKYLYVLRPLLCVEWITKGRAGDHGVPPTRISELLRLIAPYGDLYNAVYDLIERKRAGEELGKEGRIPVLDAYLEKVLAANEDAKFDGPSNGVVESLNKFFGRTVLQQII
jgi:predicted nucleotidyltransferase